MECVYLCITFAMQNNYDSNINLHFSIQILFIKFKSPTRESRAFFVGDVSSQPWNNWKSGFPYEFLWFTPRILCENIRFVAKSVATVLKKKDVYQVKNAIKLGQYNVGREGEVLTIPLYMGFLIEDKLADVIIPDIDLNLLTTIQWPMKHDEGKADVRCASASGTWMSQKKGGHQAMPLPLCVRWKLFLI